VVVIPSPIFIIQRQPPQIGDPVVIMKAMAVIHRVKQDKNAEGQEYGMCAKDAAVESTKTDQSDNMAGGICVKL
jgi:hypothetical protein